MTKIHQSLTDLMYESYEASLNCKICIDHIQQFKFQIVCAPQIFEGQLVSLNFVQ